MRRQRGKPRAFYETEMRICKNRPLGGTWMGSKNIMDKERQKKSYKTTKQYIFKL